TIQISHPSDQAIHLVDNLFRPLLDHVSSEVEDRPALDLQLVAAMAIVFERSSRPYVDSLTVNFERDLQLWLAPVELVLQSRRDDDDVVKHRHRQAVTRQEMSELLLGRRIGVAHDRFPFQGRADLARRASWRVTQRPLEIVKANDASRQPHFEK